MLRLMFVTGSLVHGGAERHSITLMNRLAERGHECHGVYVKDDPAQRDRIELRGQGSLRCLDARRYLDRRALADFAAHLARVRPQVIVAANAYALLYASLARWQAGLDAPLLVTYHSTKLLGAKEQLKMLLERFFFLAADCLVFVCENQQRYWRRRLVFARRNEVIHNGIDTGRFAAADWNGPAQVVRRRYGFAATDYVIGMVAVLRPEKNHLQLLEAVARLRQQGIPANALLVGDGPMREAIEVRARQLGIGAFVAVTGFQEDVRPYIAACDVVALCSVTEAFSLAAIEAMAMGRPVIHSDVGGAAEMIEPGRNGFLFPVGDTETLVYALTLLSDRPSALRMGSHAREVVERRFSETTMLDRYEQTLLSLCQPPSTHRSVPPRKSLLVGNQDRSSVEE
ncbi:MAG TPA: glycosyltransferase family 4 protein [Azospira sp.]|nr:glycosyltransferase family 4 protein [Azospira sp.]